MDDLIEKLEEDHRRVAHVLLKLVSELEGCHNAAFHNARLVKHFTDELSYIYEYPAHMNHPLENRIFRKLLEKSVPDKTVIERAIEEHAMLEVMAGDLLAQLHRLMQLKETPSAALLNQAQSLLNFQMEHNATEAHSVIPLIRQHLRQSEINDIRYKMLELPRYASMRRHFGSLYNNIVKHRAAG